MTLLWKPSSTCNTKALVVIGIPFSEIHALQAKWGSPEFAGSLLGYDSASVAETATSLLDSDSELDTRTFMLPFFVNSRAIGSDNDIILFEVVRNKLVPSGTVTFRHHLFTQRRIHFAQPTCPGCSVSLECDQGIETRFSSAQPQSQFSENSSPYTLYAIERRTLSR